MAQIYTFKLHLLCFLFSVATPSFLPPPSHTEGMVPCLLLHRMFHQVLLDFHHVVRCPTPVSLCGIGLCLSSHLMWVQCSDCVASQHSCCCCRCCPLSVYVHMSVCLCVWLFLQVYNSYQALLNGLDIMVQVCHCFPVMGTARDCIFSNDVCQYLILS